MCTLYKKNIDIVSITFDGASSNISMCEELGAQLKSIEIEKIVPYFVHSADKSKRIYIFYDACHIIKLVRNTINKEDLNYKENQTISWKYIKQLVSLQNAEELHLATQIRDKHVHFQNEKKVKLAVQVFSNSVSDALRFLEYDLKHPHFAAASATATFCKIFNDIFDLMIFLLKSRNYLNKRETKQAITKNKISFLKNKIDKFVSYIKCIKIKDTLILESIRKIRDLLD